jgi:hypothetical protein
MSSHLSDETFVDPLDATATDAVRAHLAVCDACRSRYQKAEDGLRLARRADVPEPSPLYWEAFRRQVERRIEAEPVGFWRWRVFGPALAAVAAAVALLSLLPGPGGAPVKSAPAPLPAWSALPPADEDDGLSLLQAMAASADDLGWAGGCRGVAECLSGLSDDESRALADAVGDEINGEPKMKGRDL